MNKNKLEKPTTAEPQPGSVTITKTRTRTKFRAKLSVKPKLKKTPPAKMQANPLSIHIQPAPISQQSIEATPSIEGYSVVAEQSPAIATEEEMSRRSAAQITAQELLDKPLEEIEKNLGKREAHNMLRNMKIITAIMLGKNKNNELAHVLDTDKSFTSKQIKELEEQGLVTREGMGKDITYAVDRFNVMKFLESRVVIKWGKTKESDSQNGDNKNGRPKENS